jgi:hypothetical protein
MGYIHIGYNNIRYINKAQLNLGDSSLHQD